MPDLQNPYQQPAADPSEARIGPGNVGFDPRRIERPDPSLLKYYVLASLLAGPLFPIALMPLVCKYITLRYRFDDDGVVMSWGVFFRREIYLTYRRIQDIHLTRNLVQRWMGLANVAIQTASGSSAPEMTIEGLLEAEPLRDYLYEQMRGAKGIPAKANGKAAMSTIQEISGLAGTADQDEVLALLTEIRDAIASAAIQRETPQ